MKVNLCIVTAVLSFSVSLAGEGLSVAVPQEKPDMLSQAEQEADRLQRLLDLEDWQVFYVDSTLKHDYVLMVGELESLSAAKVSNASMYQAVQDKWMECIDASYRNIFDDRQWEAYLKSGAAKAQKARAKRKEKAEGRK